MKPKTEFYIKTIYLTGILLYVATKIRLNLSKEDTYLYFILTTPLFILYSYIFLKLYISLNNKPSKHINTHKA